VFVQVLRNGVQQGEVLKQVMSHRYSTRCGVPTGVKEPVFRKVGCSIQVLSNWCSTRWGVFVGVGEPVFHKVGCSCHIPEYCVPKCKK